MQSREGQFDSSVTVP
nr:unnamed protein product [Callosobruchus chinensis]